MNNRWDNPEEWNAYLAEGNARQPRKRIAADVVLRDRTGRVLLVDPAYKPEWDLPGGMVETDESPRTAAERELREELGLVLHLASVLCVDWVPSHGPWDDSVAFVFDGGVLDDTQLQAVDLTDGELRAYRLVHADEAGGLVRPRLWRRLRHALHNLDGRSAIYLEDGQSHEDSVPAPSTGGATG